MGWRGAVITGVQSPPLQEKSFRLGSPFDVCYHRFGR